MYAGAWSVRRVTSAAQPVHLTRRTGQAAQVHAVAKLLMWLYKERRSVACKLPIISATGFRVTFGRSRPAHDDRKETARFPCGPRRHQPGPSHRPCAGSHDLAPVSLTVRPFSKSLRQASPPVLINVRQKPPLIARRGVHHCAPLQLTCHLREVPVTPRTLRLLGACTSEHPVPSRASGVGKSRWHPGRLRRPIQGARLHGNRARSFWQTLPDRLFGSHPRSMSHCDLG